MDRKTARAVVAGHGTFAVGIVSAVEQITGRGDIFAAVTSIGLTPADIQSAIAAAMRESGARVIFTDLPAGSCTMAARRMLRDHPGVLLVTGVNLSVLLDFAMQDDSDPVVGAHAALERGKASMMTFGA